MFTEQLPDLFDYVDSLPGFVCLVGDMNIPFDNPLQSLTKQTLSTLSLYGFVQVISKSTHRCSHIIYWVIVRPDDDIHKNLLLQTHLNQTIIALSPTSIFLFLSLLPYTGLLGTWIIIMVIFKCYFSREHIALSYEKLCEHRIRKTNRLKALRIMLNHT